MQEELQAEVREIRAQERVSELGYVRLEPELDSIYRGQDQFISKRPKLLCKIEPLAGALARRNPQISTDARSLWVDRPIREKRGKKEPKP